MSRILAVLMLALLVTVACAPVGAARKHFDIPAQPAASALNEFARQADITLIFSYDLVQSVRTRALKGDYKVDEGLVRLLTDTGLSYQRSGETTYFICLATSCGPPRPWRSATPKPEIGIAENRSSPVSMTGP